MKILLLEDHREIAGIIYDFLDAKGYTVDYANNSTQGLEFARTHHYDVVILDHKVTPIGGLETCKKLRQQGIDTPVLMLTVSDQHDDILAFFNEGADDYLVKPFDLRILEARLQALYRRKTGAVATKDLQYGSLKLNLSNRTVERYDNQCTLNQTQFTILKTLMMRAPDIATREELIKEVWQEDVPDGDVLRTHLYQLRNLIDKPFEHKFIKTIPKVGYQLLSEN